VWRLCAGGSLAFAIVVSGACNALFGIHELTNHTADAGDAGLPNACDIDSQCTGAHVVCDTSAVPRACVCAAGYGSGSGACTWTGVVANADFTTMDAWMPFGPAAIDTTEAGELGSGVGNVVDANCSNYGGFVQTVTMPRLSVAQPLVASLTYEAPEGDGPGDFVEADAGFALATSFHDSGELADTYVTERACLGAGQYAAETTTGVGVTMPLQVYINELECESSATLALNQVEIVPANDNECPSPGTALNGSAEGSGGWQFQNGTTAGDVAAIVAGVGDNASHGVELLSIDLCDLESASTTFSVPAGPSQTFSFWHSTAADYLTATVDAHPLQLTGGTTATIDTYCLPPYLAGSVFTFAAQDYPGIEGGLCSTVEDARAVVDDLTLGSDPACGSDPYVADPGFESGHAVVGNSENVADGAVAEPVTDSNAHSGTRDFLFEITRSCQASSFAPAVITPAAVGSDGPALSFWYRYPNAGTSEFYVPVYKGSFTPIKDGLWHQALACLEPERAGHAATVDMELIDQTDGLCGSAVTVEQASIDDLAAVTDPSCPTN
jgi:hypothetical protein